MILGHLHLAFGVYFWFTLEGQESPSLSGKKSHKKGSKERVR